MKYFLRKVNRRGWNGATTSEAQWRKHGLPDFTVEESEYGWSLFGAQTNTDKLLVVAAVALSRRSPQGVDILEIPKELLEAHGTLDHDGKGDTPLEEANKLHVSLVTDNARLEQLATHLHQQKFTAVRYDWATKILPEIRARRECPCVGTKADQAEAFRREVLATPA